MIAGGPHVTFSPEEALRFCAVRILRGLFTLWWGALLMSTTMNVFYGLRALTKNEPISFEDTDKYSSIREKVASTVHEHQETGVQLPHQVVLGYADIFEDQLTGVRGVPTHFFKLPPHRESGPVGLDHQDRDAPRSLATRPDYGGDQVGTDALEYCREFSFSTEEDFVTHGPEPPDGNPIISDGDLLGPNCVVCARNYDLLHETFDVTQDLGLDAADVIDVENYLVAFSTELDSPNLGQFTAGDLLVTNGVIIPNVALLYKFDLPQADLGLDALHFVGDLQDITAFLVEIQQHSRDYWLKNPSVLSQVLNRHGVDIWFSTEGTAPPVEQPAFLDGDLLSALNGTIVAANAVLLPSSVPAGIPNRGVDFGLDAFASRTRDFETVRERSFFSTEILYEGDPNFTDGDILRFGNGVVHTNEDLVGCFEPKASFLGLDALSVGEPSLECVNTITEIGGLKTHVASIGTDGRADLWYSTDHPFGDHIPIWGTICDDVIRFRVLYDDLGDGADYPTGNPIAMLWGSWELRDVDFFSPTGCTADWPLDWGTSDPDGWYGGVLFRTYRDLGGSDDCNNDLALTSWDTGPAADPNSTSPATPKVSDGLYAVWLEWETAGGTDREPVPHNVRVDNHYTNIQALEIPAGEGHCPEYSGANTSFMVSGQFSDGHFWGYQLKIDGDCYSGGGYAYPRHDYYDGTPESANLDDTGTKPDGSVVDLHAVDLTDVPPPGEQLKDCAYSVELRVWDRTIVGRWSKKGGPWDGHFRTWVSEEKYFTYTVSP